MSDCPGAVRGWQACERDLGGGTKAKTLLDRATRANQRPNGLRSSVTASALCVVALVALGLPRASAATSATAGAISSTPAAWPKFRSDAGNTGFNPLESEITTANVRSLTPVWRQDGGAVVVAGSRVFSACPGGICAQDEATGAVLWQSASGTMPGNDPGAVAGSRLIVYGSGRDASVVALDVATGAEVWRRPFPTEYEMQSITALGDGQVYVGGFDGTLFALDATTGAVTWQTVTTDRAANFSQVGAHPARSGSQLFIVDGRQASVVAMDAATGTILWRLRG